MKTIVVVEDQQVLATAYSNKFRGEGFNVEVAMDGEAGLDLITRITPDLVLLDLHLPKLSGLEVLKKSVAGGCDAGAFEIQYQPQARARICSSRPGRQSHGGPSSPSDN